jgi:hypothetical protein
MNHPYWFEIAVMFGLMAVGNILLVPFHEGRGKAWRVAKVFLGAAVAVLVSATAGRPWFFVMLGVMAAGFLAVHGWWLPRHGVNGWTAEPKDKYHALRGWTGKAP